MIKLKLSFGDKEPERSFDIEDGELLKAATERATADVPRGSLELHDMFVAILNGEKIEPDFWDKVQLKNTDELVISPQIKSGDSGQIFKQALIITLSVVASVYLGPAVGGGIYGALAVAGVTIAATLVLNALIPPPSLDLGGIGSGGAESSQMYAITGQSNKLNRLGIVPKVYGTHRMYPPLAANPYTELSVDPATGEIVQYLCAIYDFGLGTPQVAGLRIGDTELTNESFTDFTYRFVDVNLPPSGQRDSFDSGLSNTFELYRGDRTVTPLSLAVLDGGEYIQNTDENPKNYSQEIILDLVCSRGLFGYSSNGEIGERKIVLSLEFAKVGSTDWRPYNDPAHCTGWDIVGGTDLTDFKVNTVVLRPDHPLFSTYFTEGAITDVGSYNANYNRSLRVDLKLYSNTLLMKSPGVGETYQWLVGTKLLTGGVFLGNITAATVHGTYPEFTVVTLDKVISSEFPAYYWNFKSDYGSVVRTYAPSAASYMSYTGSCHGSGVANIVGSRTEPVYSSFRFKPKDPGQYRVRVRRTQTVGSFTKQTSDDLTWGALTTAFVNDPIKTDKRHVFMELKIKATDQLSGQVQNLSGVVSQPIHVYDSGTQTWSRQISNNPAWIVCDLLTNEVNKKAVPYSRLHMESILAWAAYCDEVPTPPSGQTYLEPRFQTNFILDYASTLQEVIQQVGSSAQASLNIIDGKYGVLVDRLKTVPVQLLTPRNSRDFTSNRFYAPRPHGVKVKYIDPQLAWEVTECVVYDNGFDSETATEFDDLSAFGCTNYEQAWRFGRYMIAQNRLRQETISILVDFENLAFTRGDYVQISHDVMQVGGRPARVKSIVGVTATIDDGLDIDPDISWGYTYRSKLGEIKTSTCTPTSARTFDLDGELPEVGDLIVIGEVGKLVLDCIVKAISPNDDLSAQVTLVERANEIFAYESESALPDYNPQISQTSSPDFKPPKAVVDLTLTDVAYECSDTQSGYNYYFEVVWDSPVGSVYEFFEIWVNDGRGYRTVGTTVAKYWKQSVDQTRLGAPHKLKVVAVSASGKKLDLIAMPEVVCTPVKKTSPPSNVLGFGMSITNQVLQLAWNGIPDCDIYKYELRYSPETNDIWEASTPLQVVDRNVNSVAVQARTGIYFIKAVDFAGNKSVAAATALTTIPNLFDLNIIETLNDAPLFAGFTEQVELLGSAVILSTRVFGDENTMEYYTDGYYTVKQLVDLGDIYSARLQSLIRADGFRFGELMSSWEHLADVDGLSTAGGEDWNVTAEYRATTEILSMASWAHLYDVEHLNEGLGQGFTSWRPIPTIGDATGRVFQFRIHLQSITPNVTPRLFDGTIKIDMPDRTESFENLVSEAVGPTQVLYSERFKGPSPSPNVQISIDGGAAGDYWVFENKNLEGFQIRFYDNTDTQVSRTFDVLAKGYGKRHIVTI